MAEQGSTAGKLLALLYPLRWVLYAYTVGDQRAFAYLEELFGSPPTSPAQGWERYAAETHAAREDIMADKSQPFTRFCEAFHPHPFAFFLLTLSLASELLPEFGKALSCLGGLTPHLALTLFSTSPSEALELQAAVPWGEQLIRLVFGDIAPHQSITMRPCVREGFLGGVNPPDGCALWTPGRETEPLLPCEIPEQIAAQLRQKPRGNLFCLYGARGSGRKYALLQYLRRHGGSLLTLSYDHIPSKGDKALYDIQALLVLTGSFLCILDVPEEGDPLVLSHLLTAVRPRNCFVTALGPGALPPDRFDPLLLEVPFPDKKQRAALWKACFGGEKIPDDAALLAARYRFTPGQILAAYTAARDSAAREQTAGITAASLHRECRRRSTHKLDTLASLCSADRSLWEHLVLPPRQKRLLRHICHCVRYEETVYGVWGMDAGSSYGRGVCALFSGPPGTGKTMAARAIAYELGMDLYKIDISSLVSKYIGETEKNLDSLFQEAEKSGGLLFFDEADAIFGKRGEQKDSHDRYANMQTAFLLQRFEDYKGVTLLATNLASNLDPAFVRRIGLRVEFPMPGQEDRLRLWERMLKESGKAPLHKNVDIPFLAERFALTGSEIRGIVLTAAFMAASDTGSIGMGELVNALVMECAKTDKLLGPAELGEYGDYLRDEGD